MEKFSLAISTYQVDPPCAVLLAQHMSRWGIPLSVNQPLMTLRLIAGSELAVGPAEANDERAQRAALIFSRIARIPLAHPFPFPWGPDLSGSGVIISWDAKILLEEMIRRIALAAFIYWAWYYPSDVPAFLPINPVRSQAKTVVSPPPARKTGG
jgi:hypothetical protein